MLGREHLLSREEVMRLQELRGAYGIASPAPICINGSTGVTAGHPADCQVVQAPSAPGGAWCRTSRAGTGRVTRPQVRQAGTGRFG